jgi:hypothetical protein
MKESGQMRKLLAKSRISMDLRKIYKEQDTDLLALMNAINKGRGWGDVMLDYNQYVKEHETSAERRVREKKERESKEKIAQLEREGKERALQKAMEENAEKKRKRHLDKKTGLLKKIAKRCKWQCKGEKCWAHNSKLCPYIHKGEPGWNEPSAVPKPGGKAAGQGEGGGSTRKQRRRSSRKTRRA